MPNRIFYGCTAVEINSGVVQGAQSVGLTTNQTLDQAFQLGRVSLYDNTVVDGQIEITVSKVLDKASSLWKLATGGGTIIDNIDDRSTIKIGIGSDTAASVSSGVGVVCTGFYVSSIGYNFPVDGAFTEDITFIGDNINTGATVNGPSTAKAPSGVARRGTFSVTGGPAGTILSASIKADFGREAIYGLASTSPVHRYANFPFEVTTEFEVLATGVPAQSISYGTPCSTSTAGSALSITACGYTFNLGSGNVLESVNYNGGDTGGGNATITYTYKTYNDLDISG
jgi:hypothetical protein